MEESDVLSFREKSTFFLGRAKVQISNLDFDRVVQIHEKRHVEKLVDVFREEGCHRLDPWNHVPVIVSRTLLSQSLQTSGVSHDDLMKEGEPAALEFSVDLPLLHGRRRLLAAEAEDCLWNKWWVVEMYSDGRFVDALLMWKTDLPPQRCRRNSRSPFVNNIYIHGHSAMGTYIDIFSSTGEKKTRMKRRSG